MTIKYEKLQIDGVEYRTTFTTKWASRKKWEEPNPYLIESHIPGTVNHIDVKEGQEVQEGELLLVLTAMKMDNKITAPFAGKIKKISVAKGDKVPKGMLMIEME